MFSHVTLGSNDIRRAAAFYGRVLAPLGLSLQEGGPEQGFLGYAAAPDATPQFWLLAPADGQAATIGNGLTIAFEAPDRATVDAVHAAALAAGGRDEGGPGLRPHYHADYYGAYARDLDGHKICVVCHRPPG